MSARRPTPPALAALRKEARRIVREQDAAEEAEYQAWKASLKPSKDPEGDRRRQRILMAISGLSHAVDEFTEYTPDDVRWAIDTEFEHMRKPTTEKLRHALDRLKGYEPDGGAL